MSKLVELRQEQIQKEQQVLEELVTKFDGDQELLEAFLEEGYSVQELQGSEIIHPTKFDPLVRLSTGHTAGFWIDKPSEMKWRDDSRTYQYRFSS